MLTKEDKLFWLSYIETKLGLVLPQIQQRRFESRILARLKALNVDSDAYFKEIKNNETEWQFLIDELIIPETSFFRHQPSFDLVAEHLSGLTTPAYLWSVGCASGEEAWSLAMIAHESNNDYRIMATDVSQNSVTMAKNGIYSSRKLLGIDQARLQRHFESYKPSQDKPDGQNHYRVLDHLRESVSFYQHNLIDDKRLPFRELDVIYCQNVLIYFHSFVQRDVLNQLVRSLSEGGILVLGPGEARGWQHPLMERVQSTSKGGGLNTQTLAFQKIGSGGQV